MKRIQFYNTNRSDNLLHIETEGCIVNIRVNLTDVGGRAVTNISVIPDRQKGEEWEVVSTSESQEYGSVNVKKVKHD